MISKTEMLAGMDKVNHRITEVLESWIHNEGNNLQSFINNPSGHVNYNPYVILDYTKLQERLDMLRIIENSLHVVSEYKKGNPNFTRSMYETELEKVHSRLLERLLEWLEKRYADMTEFITSKSGGSTAPLDDYQSMFTFDEARFTEEYNMYKEAIDGSKVVIQYKKENGA